MKTYSVLMNQYSVNVSSKKRSDEKFSVLAENLCFKDAKSFAADKANSLARLRSSMDMLHTVKVKRALRNTLCIVVYMLNDDVQVHVHISVSSDVLPL